MIRILKFLLIGFTLSCTPENEHKLPADTTDTLEAQTKIDSAKRKTRKDGVQVEVPDTGKNATPKAN